jgi:hypothetical protein
LAQSSNTLHVRPAAAGTGVDTPAHSVPVTGGGTALAPGYVSLNAAGDVVNPATEEALAAAGTRAYNFAQATRTAVGATSSAAVAIGTLSASREVMLVASTRCFIRFGTSSVAAANATDAALLALPADAMFHMRLPSGVTHYTVIRDTADGFVRIVPVL